MCRMPRVGRGDVVAFLDTGAYQDAAASNFNVLARPGIVLREWQPCAACEAAWSAVDEALGRAGAGRTGGRAYGEPASHHIGFTVIGSRAVDRVLL